PVKPEVPTTVEPLGDIVAEKVINKSKVKPGETVTYTINVKNTVEGSTLKDVVVKDHLPKGFTLDATSLQVNGEAATAKATKDGFEVVIPELKGLETATITFNADVSKDIEAGKHVNVAEVTNPEDPDKPVKPEVPTTVDPLGELEAEKLINKDKVQPGETVEYTINVTNTVKGSKVENAALVADQLPAGMTLVKDSVKLNGKAIDVKLIGDNAFEYTIEALKGEETAKLTFEAVVSKDIDAGTLVNVAIITNPDKPEDPPLTPEVPTTVEPKGAIEATKEINKDKVKPGETVT
ncbi:DUF11 domain-containing protein, partial [Planococcaceae bacterium Storch 2/2-2]|nr:DUF11 domain-containing protein [Planococcaceae bacterium Storch 2/2-2]